MIQDVNKRQEQAKKRIEDVLEGCKIEDPELQKRLKALALRWEDAPYGNNSRILYTLRLFDLPEAFTWAEIDDLLANWEDPFAVDAIKNIIDNKREELGKNFSDVVKELLDALLSKYNLTMEGAASAYTSSEQAAKIAEADQILRARRGSVLLRYNRCS